jgi:hypothetical protein
MSGHAGDAGLSTFGLALELEARSGAIGALRERERSKLIIRRRNMSEII